MTIETSKSLTSVLSKMSYHTYYARSSMACLSNPQRRQRRQEPHSCRFWLLVGNHTTVKYELAVNWFILTGCILKTDQFIYLTSYSEEKEVGNLQDFHRSIPGKSYNHIIFKWLYKHISVIICLLSIPQLLCNEIFNLNCQHVWVQNPMGFAHKGMYNLVSRTMKREMVSKIPKKKMKQK